MSDLVPQCGYRPQINPYYKCFTDVRYDPFLSSIVFFNRFIKQPVAYLDARLFLKGSNDADDLTSVNLVNENNNFNLVFNKKSGATLSVDVTEIHSSDASLSTVQLLSNDNNWYLVFNEKSGNSLSTDVTELYNSDLDYLFTNLVDITAAYDYAFYAAVDTFVEFLSRWQRLHPDKVKPFIRPEEDD